MLTATFTEFSKLKRSKIVWFMLAGPALVALIFLLVQIFAPEYIPIWPMHLYAGFTVWAYFMMPMTAAVVVTMLAQLEHGPKTWAHLFSLPVAKWNYFAAKAVVALILLAIMTVLMAAFMYLGGELGGRISPDNKLINPDGLLALAQASGQSPCNEMDGDGPEAALGGVLCGEDWRYFLAERLGLIFLSGFLLIAIQLWAALIFRNFLIPLAIGVGGTFVALVMLPFNLGEYFPWLIPANMLMLGGDKFIIAFSLGFGGGLVVFALMLVHMSRMEIK